MVPRWNCSTLHRADFVDLRIWIDERRITLLHPPVVLFRRYLSTLEGSGLHPSVRLLALAGDTVVASDIQQWRHRFATSCALRHRFLSTEAGHIAVACVEPGAMPMPGVVPAPHPVADKFLSVIDEHGNTVKKGESGELVVRSAFLADGYWRRAEESADHFQIAPNHPNERLFRTGDMVRLLADGGFEFLGRRDDQVKIRGYRVETREIELAFLQLPGVKEAAVMADPASEGILSGQLRRDEAGSIVPGRRIEVRVAIDLPAMENSGLHLSDRVVAVDADRQDRQAASPPVCAIKTTAGQDRLTIGQTA